MNARTTRQTSAKTVKGPAKSRKATTGKGTPAKTRTAANKGVSRAIGKEQERAEPKTVELTYYFADSDSPYDCYDSDGSYTVANPNKIKGAQSLVMLENGGYINLAIKGEIVTVLPTGKPGALAIIQRTVPALYKRLRTLWGNSDNTALNDAGLNKMAERGEGRGSFGTTAELVSRLRVLVRKGGALKYNGQTIKFDKPVKVVVAHGCEAHQRYGK